MMKYKEIPLSNPHQYIGRIAVLKDGRHCRIIGDKGLPSSPTHRIIMQDLDGEVFTCYHTDIENVMGN